MNPVLEKDRETQLKTSYLTFLQAHEEEKPQDIEDMILRLMITGHDSYLINWISVN